MPRGKRELHPKLQANADRLKRGEPIYKDKKVDTRSQRPKIRSKQKKG